MSDHQENQILDRITETVKTLSQTTEYKVREAFKKLGYFSDPYHYEDFDPERKVKVQRELDFLSSISASKEVIGNEIRVRRNRIFGKKSNLDNSSWVSFIGDVKYLQDGPIRIVGFQDESLSQMNFGGAFSTQLIKCLIMKDLRDLPRKSTIGDFGFPVCRQLEFFNKKGKLLKIDNKKYTIHSFCNQIISGFNARKSDGEKTIDRGFNILFPLLVFGNDTRFITGSPTNILNRKFESPDGIVYRFAPSTSFEIRPFNQFWNKC
jgi:hypothetical protein